MRFRSNESNREQRRAGSRGTRGTRGQGGQGDKGEVLATSRQPLATHTTPDSPKFAQIQVTDTGQGISPEFLPYIFERFRQADDVTTRSKDGLGLGLAIARHLVELHGERSRLQV
ncbi:ATP-binding protein [Chroococcidiopsis cubana]|uniref:ATP-binding protein n=1 Tax=Chroococcidiopsis cubana TaxID=171392 RepID=UPI002ACEDD96|nr:ATP-binding protein [Chroococcidiopsis cubana]